MPLAIAQGMKAIVLAALLAAASVACLAKDSAAKLVQQTCGPCHNERVRPLSEQHLTRQQWQEAIDRMAAYGVSVPDEKLQELLDHLARAYGAVPAEPAANTPSRPTTPRRNNP